MGFGYFIIGFLIGAIFMAPMISYWVNSVTTKNTIASVVSIQPCNAQITTVINGVTDSYNQCNVHWKYPFNGKMVSLTSYEREGKYNVGSTKNVVIDKKSGAIANGYTEYDTRSIISFVFGVVLIIASIAQMF
jgi:hypothetical protein